MFNWDDDVSDLYETRSVGMPPAAEQPERVSRGGLLRTAALRWVAPAALVAGMLSAGITLFDPGFESARAARASFGSIGTLLFGVEIGEPPAELVAYGPQQFQNFMLSVAAFSDNDLLEYATTTARDLGDYADPATPFMLDVLFLTHREIERRGLRSPTASLQHEAMRDSFRGAQAAL